jgi:hypothetical protein
MPKLGRSNGLRKRLDSIEMPKLDASTFDWVESKAKDVGDAANRVAELSSQARRARQVLKGKDAGE